MRRHAQFADDRDEIAGVIPLVGADGPPPAGGSASVRVEHQHRRIALGGAVRLRRHRVDDESVPILDQQMAEILRPRLAVMRARYNFASGSVFEACVSFRRCWPRKSRPSASGGPSFG